MLGAAPDDDDIERLFVETAGYSDRVRDLGLWQPPVLPWVQQQPNRWFPDDPGTWPPAGLMIEGRKVQIPPSEVPGLQAAVQDAIEGGQKQVTFTDRAGEQHRIPAEESTLRALSELPGAATRRPPSETATAAEPHPTTVLIIEPNLDDLGHERIAEKRHPRRADSLPSSVLADLMPHQHEGVAWLQRAWAGGEPGVLLADDMGLGKTLQALAFLDWVGRTQIGAAERRPFLVVAPTGLLRNWEAEHARHLRAPGLGEPLRLFGPTLRSLLGTPERIRKAGWVLTTYETWRDHHTVLGTVRFAVALLDEAQKIKNPGSLVTNAAKSINADFMLAMTGTPVENRLADLWSITDPVHSGLLRELKGFSRRFEGADASAEDLGKLKRWLVDERKVAATEPPRPPFMLRRTKEDRLDGLAEKRVVVREAPMPVEQAAAYQAAVATARGGRKGDVLKALQGLRAVSLHPGDASDDPDGFVARSARWTQAFEIMAEIARRGEKALVFLESLALQPVLAALIHRRFGLRDLPMIINGAVPGPQRQSRVDAFQRPRSGFDVMILGPKAAGVGLTLTAANHVIHLSRWWNPAVEDQCTDRAHRIGQERPVTVWLPLALFPDGHESSFDRQLHALLERKRTLSRDILAPPAASDRDAEDLFRAIVG